MRSLSALYAHCSQDHYKVGFLNAQQTKQTFVRCIIFKALPTVFQSSVPERDTLCNEIENKTSVC